jgi:hypothetical protein
MEVINGRQADSQGQRAFCDLVSNTCALQLEIIVSIILLQKNFFGFSNELGKIKK